MVAGVAWFAVHRGLRVDELRSDLLTTVSHEIKTPLASMRVLLETLTDDDAGIVANEEKRREYLDLVLRENRRLTRLADDFLTFARLERGDHRLRREICDVGRIVQVVIEELSPAIEAAGARIGIEVAAPLMAWGDADALAAVVRNLLENALKYGAAGDQPPRIVVSAAESGRRHLILTVSDDGPGIAPEFRRAVFRRYFRIDSRLAGGGSGVGLGLAICRHLTRKMRGRVTVEPNSGGGCRFVVRLARAEGVAGAATAPRPVPIPIRS